MSFVTVYQDPGTQNSVSPNGNSVVNRPEVSQENPGYFGEFMKTGTNIPSMLNLSGESHLMQSNYNTIQVIDYLRYIEIEEIFKRNLQRYLTLVNILHVFNEYFYNFFKLKCQGRDHLDY